jgi:FkbM family methyltransferase
MNVLYEGVSLGRKTLRRVLPDRGVAKLKAMWADYSFRRFKPRIVRHRYGAYEFQIEIVDFDGQAWYDMDLPELASEIDLFKKSKLRPGAKIINAGANQCIQAMMLAKEVEPNGFCWAIEPNHHNVRAGRRNAELNGIQNMEVIEAAVSSTPGTVFFNSSMNGRVTQDGNESGAHSVPAITIDGLAAEKGTPQLLYIDVEGFECEVLKGAQETLHLCRPDCYVEVHLQMGLERFGGSVEKVLSFFPRNQYDLFFNCGDGTAYQPVGDPSDLPKKRFYLAALSR